MRSQFKHALIIGAGDGLSASLGRLFLEKGLAVSLARRSPDPADATTVDFAQRGVPTHACDSADPSSVEGLFAALDAGAHGAPDVLVYNPSARARGALADLDPADVRRALEVCAFGAFLCAQQAVRRMLEKPEGDVRGAILFTGASASVKGYPLSAPFAMGKFAQRGLAQSLARELHPKGVHIGHINIDGGIRSASRGRMEGADQAPDSLLDPDAIARSYWHFLEQDRSAWSWELDLRPWVERF